jgi:hypothetical protein
VRTVHLIVTNSMEQNSSWEASSSSASKKIPHSLFNQNLHYRVHKNPPLAPLLAKSIHPISSTSVSILSSHIRQCLPSGFFLSCFPTKTYVHVFPHTCYVHHPFSFSSYDYSNNIWWGVCITNLLHPPVTSSHLVPNIFLNTLFSTILSLCSYLNMSKKTS